MLSRDELFVGESAPTARVQVDATNEGDVLNARVEVTRYYATGSDRPAGVVKVTGSGLVNPYA